MLRHFAPALAICCLLLGGCDPGEEEPTDAGTTGEDAGPPPTCADPATTYAFPSPRWESAGGLLVPEGDLAGDAVRGQGWADELEGVEAWPRRPTLIVPLDRAAEAVDPSSLALAVHDGSGWRLSERPFTARLVAGGRTLVVQPRDPFPVDAVEVIVAFEPGLAGDAKPLGTCGADGETDPAYAAAAGEWPDDRPLDLALRLRIADGSAPLRRLWERLEAEPALTVASSEAASADDLGEDAPAPEMAPRFAFPVLRGQLDLPEYRRSEGPMELGADGAPAAQGTTSPGFVVALPSEGTAPFPVVLYQHGGGQSPMDVFDFGGALAEAGFAFVAIDLPEHGLRGPAGGGGELDFLDFDSPQRTRENFRQAVADHLAVLTGLDALNAAIAAQLGVDDALDPARTFYMGMSLGGVSGSMTTSVARGLGGSALFVGGAGYPELMSYGLFELAASRILRGGEPRPDVMLAVVEAVGDAADPLAYARVAEDRSARPTPILFMQAVDDPLISHAASDQWARAFGASLARPLDHEVEGMPLVDLPAADTFRFADGAEAATRVLVQNPMSEIQVGQRHGALLPTDYAQVMVTACFTSVLSTGSCEVIDTGFADR